MYSGMVVDIYSRIHKGSGGYCKCYCCIVAMQICVYPKKKREKKNDQKEIENKTCVKRKL